jgi:dihydrofolate reductase
MGLVHIELFATLDLVGQAPGGPDEDPVGFPFGGWQAPLLDEVTGAQIGAAYEGTDALLLGRRTFDIFAAYWPYQDGEDNEIATLFNSVPKYVASRGRPDLSWAGSTQLGPDLAGAVREICDRHEHVKVVGSLNLVQTLLREKLFDRLDLWVHPVVLGVGTKVFDGGAVPTNVRLLEPPVAGPKGTVYLRYGLADGTPETGDMSAPDR